MKVEQVVSLAEKIGFSHIGQLNVEALNFRQEVRDMCSADKCRKYGKCWTCPPYCGTLDESREKASRYSCGIILQTTGNMEDDFDIECIQDTQKTQKEHFTELVKEMRAVEPDLLPMGSGGCSICESCACPDEPCRFPDRAFTSMEAYGLVVADTCRDSNMKYYYGPLTMTFTSCILFNEKEE